MRQQNVDLDEICRRSAWTCQKTAAEKSGSNRCAGTTKNAVPPIFLAAKRLKMLPKCAVHFSKHH